MKNYALIGHPVDKSLSAVLFENFCRERAIADCRYMLCDMAADEIGGLHRWVEENDVYGFNVTQPYKRVVMDVLDGVDDVARAVGAVNCVVVDRSRGDVRLIGHNTDVVAFGETIDPYLKPHHRSALILGTGGAARAVAYALRQRGIDCVYVSRDPNGCDVRAMRYGWALEQVDYRTVVVNATPLGMMPDEGSTPWANSYLLGEQHLCYDLVYRPEETRFMREARAQGATVVGGMRMLERQALLSYRLWRVGDIGVF